MTTDFGQDTFADDAYRSGRYASGLLLVAQNALHRLVTPTGMLLGGEEEALYGLDIPGMIGHDSSVVPTLPGRIYAQLTLDERIVDVGTEITESVDGPVTTVNILVNCQTHAGPFTLKLSVADGEVTTEILGISEEGT
jgi:hypothetical protein